jgi:hypothetical protein
VLEVTEGKCWWHMSEAKVHEAEGFEASNRPAILLLPSHVQSLQVVKEVVCLPADTVTPVHVPPRRSSSQTAAAC